MAFSPEYYAQGLQQIFLQKFKSCKNIVPDVQDLMLLLQGIPISQSISDCDFDGDLYFMWWDDLHDSF